MSDRPPPEDPWSEVLEQVEHALVDAGIRAEPDRSALLDGVRSALDSLVGIDTGGEGPPPREPAGPDVHVVEGGRGAGEPPTEGDAPPLRVADAAASPPPGPEDDWGAGSAASWAESDDDPWPDGWPDPGQVWRGEPRVVVRVPAPRAEGPFPALADQGRFVLAPGASARTLFVGPSARAYRVACAEGAVRIGVDGGMELPLGEGCSVDVEARQLTVRPEGEHAARGRYVRLAPERT